MFYWYTHDEPSNIVSLIVRTQSYAPIFQSTRLSTQYRNTVAVNLLYRMIRTTKERNVDVSRPKFMQNRSKLWCKEAATDKLLFLTQTANVLFREEVEFYMIHVFVLSTYAHSCGACSLESVGWYCDGNTIWLFKIVYSFDVAAWERLIGKVDHLFQ